MSDPVRRLSEELARDPASLAFITLAEELRRRGDAETAYRIARRGLERHPFNARAHDLVARLAADRGELEVAYDCWDAAARLDPSLLAALKGQAFVRFQQGRLAEAEAHLREAALRGGEDAELARGLERVRAAALDDAWADVTPPAGVEPQTAPSRLFADLLEERDLGAALIGANGAVLAGAIRDSAGADVAPAVGRALGDVGVEATRAMRHLALGDWRALHVEAEHAVVALAPVDDGVAVVAAPRETPLGHVRRLLARVVLRARDAGGRAP
jgi:predicted regulator of Ras-like GTPase activity (Roadblock/LC7/MglB family)